MWNSDRIHRWSYKYASIAMIKRPAFRYGRLFARPLFLVRSVGTIRAALSEPRENVSRQRALTARRISSRLAAAATRESPSRRRRALDEPQTGLASTYASYLIHVLCLADLECDSITKRGCRIPRRVVYTPTSIHLVRVSSTLVVAPPFLYTCTPRNATITLRTCAPVREMLVTRSCFGMLLRTEKE